MGDHGIDIAAVDQHRVARAADREKVLFAAEIGLGQDRDLIPLRFENTRDDRGAEGGVIDISVASNEQKIAVIPAARGHILFGNGEKIVHFTPLQKNNRFPIEGNGYLLFHQLSR